MAGLLRVAAEGGSGSPRASRAGFGALAETVFLIPISRKVRDREGACGVGMLMIAMFVFGRLFGENVYLIASKN